MFDTRFFRVYIIPGAVFQSVMIGGGYGTGREIIEYFTAYGFIGGLLGLLVAFLAIGTILALTFELARRFGVREYRSFFKVLLGRWWFLFEILIILQFLLVLAVLASASGNILRDSFDLPYSVGLVLMLVVIGVLTYYGREAIAKVLTFWSFVLYAVFIAFFIAVLATDWDTGGGAGGAAILGGWWLSGLQYALYNVAALPLLLYVARDFETRAETFRSGMIGGAIAIIPAVILHVSMYMLYPDVLEQPIPVYWMMAQMAMPVLLLCYSIMLFGTFIETGAGMLQGINDRIDAWLVEKRHRGLTRPAHAALAIVAIIVSALLGFWGITSLIAQGYGTMAWGFLFVYVLPLFTVGVWRIFRGGEPAPAMAGSCAGRHGPLEMDGRRGGDHRADAAAGDRDQ
ncbi:MAG TPA: hypothetical protein VFG91_04365 [Woeseiaceae bacterium]|nr:hypothetical protein [Woeseiaceae bacterium]